MSRKRHRIRAPRPGPPTGRPGRKSLGMWAAGALAVAALGLTSLLLPQLSGAPPSAGASGPAAAGSPGAAARPARAVAQTFAQTPPAPQPADPSLLNPTTALPAREIAPGPAAFGTPVTLSPPYEVEDSMTILTSDWRVRLVGLEGPSGPDVCFDGDNKLWACGLGGRAALYNAIRLRPVICKPTGGLAGIIPLAECSVDGKRLDRTLVAAGFARPLGDRQDLRRELADARANGRGLWNGGWRIRR